MTATGWFLQSGTRRFGPLSDDEMRAYFRAGMVKGNDVLHAPGRDGPLTVAEAADELGLPAPPPIPAAPTPYEPPRKPAMDGVPPAVAIAASATAPAATIVSTAPPSTAPLVPPPPTSGFKVTERGPDSRWPVVLWIAVLFGLHLFLAPKVFPEWSVAMGGFAVLSFVVCSLVVAAVFFGFSRLATAMRARPPRVHFALAALTLAYVGLGARHLLLDSTRETPVQAVDVRAGIILWDRIAQDLADRKDYNGLLAHANRWLAERENHYLALYWRGVALEGLGRWTEAVRDYEGVARIKPGEAWAWFRLGDARIETKDYAGAVHAYRRGLDLDATSVSAWNNLGVAYGHTQRPDDQVRAYERAVELDPEFALGWANLARVHANEGRREKAAEARARAEALGGG